jgi:16S rRNA (cytosine1402-N4)-methyltransferase
MSKYHEPVLLAESIEGLMIKPGGIYVDVTFGGGGHSRELLKCLSDGRLIAIDQDQDAVNNSIKGNDKFTMINTNFRHLTETLSSLNIFNVDGLIADLGVSAHHFTDNARGFSTQHDAIIDMRMSKKTIKRGVDVINNYSAQQLNRIFKEHADFKKPSIITNLIIRARQKNEIKTTFEFKNIFNHTVSSKKKHQFFARLFQAVRIEVNDEINALKDLLIQAEKLLKPSGRLVVLSYHSIEDKIVKSFMKFGNFNSFSEKDFFGKKLSPFKLITKRPIVPTDLEIKLNNKARSAKLRICEKL